MILALMLSMVMENILRTTGMLPSPCGAIFSAPMVNEAAGDANITPEQKALINYWYRHI